MNQHKVKELRKKIRKNSNSYVLQFLEEMKKESFSIRFRLAMKIIFDKYFSKIKRFKNVKLEGN